MEAIIKLLETHKDTKNILLQKIGPYDENILNYVCWQKRGEFLKAIISFYHEQGMLGKASVMRDKAGSTSLHTVARYQDSAGFRALIEIKYSQTFIPKMIKQINKILEKGDRGVLLYNGKSMLYGDDLKIVNYQDYLID